MQQSRVRLAHRSRLIDELYYKEGDDMLLKISLACVVICSSFLAYSVEQKTDYKCTIKNANQITKDGKPAEVESWNFYLGKEFTVERKSGVISGKQFKNNIASIKPIVYDHFANGYSVIAATNDQVYSYLQVNNFEESQKKPFILIQTNVVLTGICSPY
ncbi:MAG: hypothetical protein ACI91R_001606 [Vicingaceae bacterium]|jgi:hypothetical protein